MGIIIVHSIHWMQQKYFRGVASGLLGYAKNNQVPDIIEVYHF